MVKVNQEKLREFMRSADPIDKAVVKMALWYVTRGANDVSDPLVREAIRLLYELGIIAREEEA